MALIQLDASNLPIRIDQFAQPGGFTAGVRQCYPPAEDHNTPYGSRAQLELVVHVGELELALGLTDRQAALIGRGLDIYLTSMYPASSEARDWPSNPGIWARELNPDAR